MSPSKKKKTARKSKRPVKAKNLPARILVVDDEPDFARMVARALAREGYKVDEAVTARRAIELARAHAYDLAVVDLKMPEMTGLELLQYLRARDQKLAVLIMTAYGSIQVGIDSLKKGASDYLSKPFKLDALQGKVKDALARRRRYLEEQTLRLGQETVDEY